MVDDGGADRRSLLLRAALASACSLLAVLVSLRLQLRPLDVALYAVLTPISLLTLLVAVPRAGLAARRSTRGPATPSVVPEPEAATDGAAPATSEPRELTVVHARDRLVAAGAAGGDLEQLLALSGALHDAALELARTTLASGGDVPQELRDEIVLLDRAERAEPVERVEPKARVR